MEYPWEANNWIPGVLNEKQVAELCDSGLITGPGDIKGSIDGSSIDLSLSHEGYEMTKGSVKPSGENLYGWHIGKSGLGKRLDPSSDGTFLLEPRKTYVFKLRERLSRALCEGGIHGQATAKSSVGRIDVLARLVVDGMDRYECFDPGGLARQCGDMYVEVTPITFRVKVKEGAKLTQLRLFYGEPRHAEVEGKQLYRAVLGRQAEDGFLTVDL